MTEYLIIASTLVLALFVWVYGSGAYGSRNLKTVIEKRTYGVLETLQQPIP